MNLQNLAHQIESSFTIAEIQNICFDLGIEYENIEGNTKSNKARSLVKHCKRTGQLAQLVEQCKQLRPSIRWELAKASEDQPTSLAGFSFKPLRIILTVLFFSITASILFINNQTNLDLSQLEHPIFISQIINPPGDNPSETAVWLLSHGSDNYIIDSISIWQLPIIRNTVPESIPNGALAPDAQYQFDIGFCTTNKHILNPALLINSEANREIFFTLGIGTTKDLGECLGWATDIRAAIHYHKSGQDEQGTLLLLTPSEDSITLSKRLNKNILIDTEWHIIEGGIPGSLNEDLPHYYVVAPNGLQVGYHQNVDAIEYAPLSIEFSKLIDFSLNDVPTINNIANRTELNQTILASKEQQVFLNLVSQGEKLGFDLCAGLIIDPCEEALLNSSKNNLLLPISAEALAIRHILEPNETLPNFILANIEQLSTLNYQQEDYPVLHCYGITIINGRQFCSSHRLEEQFIDALASYPVGNAFDALITLAMNTNSSNTHTNVCKALQLHIDILNQSQRQYHETSCS